MFETNFLFLWRFHKLRFHCTYSAYVLFHNFRKTNFLLLYNRQSFDSFIKSINFRISCHVAENIHTPSHWKVLRFKRWKLLAWKNYSQVGREVVWIFLDVQNSSLISTIQSDIRPSICVAHKLWIYFININMNIKIFHSNT